MHRQFVVTYSQTYKQLFFNVFLVVCNSGIHLRAIAKQIKFPVFTFTPFYTFYFYFYTPVAGVAICVAPVRVCV